MSAEVIATVHIYVADYALHLRCDHCAEWRHEVPFADDTDDGDTIVTEAMTAAYATAELDALHHLKEAHAT